jgi:ABC-type Fe3+/spermidine/putrescine transport system ATPase subunit
MERLRLKVADEGLIVLFASNDYEQMMLASDRVAVIINGTMRQVGTPQELYESPRTVDVARSIGRNNLIEARRLTSSKADIPEFQTMDGGHRLFAKKAEVSQLGSINNNITLAMRPEHISISFGASFPEDNLLKATITDVRFLGPTTLVKLDAGGLGLDALVLRLVGLNVGDECMVGLPPDRISILHN